MTKPDRYASYLIASKSVRQRRHRYCKVIAWVPNNEIT
jgi:hypothetical protein